MHWATAVARAFVMEVHTAESTIRGFHVYGDRWSPVIGEVLVSWVFNFADGPRPAKIAKLNPPRTFQRIRYLMGAASVEVPQNVLYHACNRLANRVAQNKVFNYTTS